MPTRRQLRVSKRIVQEVSRILPQLKDERLGFVTVVDCEIAPDMRNAKILVSVLGDDDKRIESLEVLESSTTYVRRELGKSLQMKVTPDIIFREDKGSLKADELAHLISLARASDPNPGPLPEPQDDASATEDDCELSDDKITEGDFDTWAEEE